MSKLTIRHLVLAAAPLFVLACGSSNSSNNGSGGSSGGSGGTTGGSGGAAAGSGGTSGGSGGAGETDGGGSGGASGSGGAPATGGASGSGGTTAGTGGADAGVVGDGGVATCAAASATSPLISDFSMTLPVSDQAVGGTDVWTASPAGMSTVTVTAGEMHVASTGGDWASASTLLAAKMPCVNAAKYTGISFKIHSATETSLIFEILTPETSADSSGFRTTVALTPTATTVMVPFASLLHAPFGVGMTLPVTYKPAEHIYAIAFGVGVMTEHMDLSLDDVTFYQ